MGDRFTELSCEEFSDRLAARESAPGGGGAAALVGALGTALCSMAGAFAQGNPRCAEHEADVAALMEEAEDVRYRLLELVEEDADGFGPVLAAWRMPKDDPARAGAIESGSTPRGRHGAKSAGPALQSKPSASLLKSSDSATLSCPSAKGAANVI